MGVSAVAACVGFVLLMPVCVVFVVVVVVVSVFDYVCLLPCFLLLLFLRSWGGGYRGVVFGRQVVKREKVAFISQQTSFGVRRFTGVHALDEGGLQECMLWRKVVYRSACFCVRWFTGVHALE